MEKNIIITILPSFFLKLFDELSDNPNKYKKLIRYKKSITVLMILSTILYTGLGSGYSFLLLIHGVFCALQKQIDDHNYVFGMVILSLGIVFNSRNQLRKILTTSSGIKYLLFTFFCYIRRKTISRRSK